MTDEEWTFGTLERFLSEKISALHKLVDQRNCDSEKALDAALHSMEARLESMNKFREALADQRLADEKNRSIVEDTFLTKEIYSLEQRNLETGVHKNAERIIEIDKKLFALSELKVDKREGLSAKYMNSVIIFAALSFIGSIASIILGVFSHH